MAHRKLLGVRPGVRSSSLRVALVLDAPLRLEERLLERFADELFRLAHRYSGELLVVSRSGMLVEVRGPGEPADAIRAAGERAGPLRPLLEVAWRHQPNAVFILSGWRAPPGGGVKRPRVRLPSGEPGQAAGRLQGAARAGQRVFEGLRARDRLPVAELMRGVRSYSSVPITYLPACVYEVYPSCAVCGVAREGEGA